MKRVIVCLYNIIKLIENRDLISTAEVDTQKLFFLKIHSRGKLSKHYTSRVLYIPLSSPHSPIFGTKPVPCRRFLQHYYRDTFIESHRKPREVLEMSYCGRLICSMPLPCKQKEVFTQILQIIHHFKYHSLHVCKFFCIFATNYQNDL